MRSFALAADPGRRRSSSGRAARARAARRQRSRLRLLPRLGSRRRRRVTCGSTPHTLSPAAPANRISPTLGQTQMRAINFSPRTRKKSRDEGASRTRFPRWPRRSPTRRAASGHPLRRYLGHLLVTTCGLYKSQCSSCNFTICDENPQIMKIHDLYDSDCERDELQIWTTYGPDCTLELVAIMLNLYLNSYETSAASEATPPCSISPRARARLCPQERPAHRAADGIGLPVSTASRHRCGRRQCHFRGGRRN